MYTLGADGLYLYWYLCKNVLSYICIHAKVYFGEIISNLYMYQNIQ